MSEDRADSPLEVLLGLVLMIAILVLIAPTLFFEDEADG